VNSNVGIYGRGGGVGRARGVGRNRGVGEGRGVAVAVTVAVGVGEPGGVGGGLAVAVAVGIAVADGLGVGVGVPVPSSLRQTTFSPEGTGKQIVTISARSFDIRDRALRKSLVDRNPRCAAVGGKEHPPPRHQRISSCL